MVVLEAEVVLLVVLVVTADREVLVWSSLY